MTSPSPVAVAVSTPTPPAAAAAPIATAEPANVTPSSTVGPLVDLAGQVARLEELVRACREEIAATSDRATKAELEGTRQALERRLESLEASPEVEAVEVLDAPPPPPPAEPAAPTAPPLKPRGLFHRVMFGA